MNVDELIIELSKFKGKGDYVYYKLNGVFYRIVKVRKIEIDMKDNVKLLSIILENE